MNIKSFHTDIVEDGRLLSGIMQKKDQNKQFQSFEIERSVPDMSQK